MIDSRLYPGFWKGVGACFLILGMSFFVGIFDWIATSITQVNMGFSLLLSTMCAWFVLNMLQRYKLRTFSYQFKVKQKSLYVWLFLCAIGLMLGVTIPLQEVLPSIPILDKLLNDIMRGILQIPAIVLIGATVIMAPVFEELIFRGILLNGFMHRYSKTKAVLLSAFFFSLVHIIPHQMLTAFILGCYLGWIYAKTRNSALVIAGHLFNNGLAMLLTFLLFNKERFLSDQEPLSFYTEFTSRFGFTTSVLIYIGSVILFLVSMYKINKLLIREGFSKEEPPVENVMQESGLS